METIPISMGKNKAYLRKGARPLPGYEEYPNEEVGWGEDVIIRLH